MVNLTITGRKVAILVTDGFEQSELLEPRRTLQDEGAETKVISLKPGRIKAWNKTDWGVNVEVDAVVDRVKVQEFDALVLPGGVLNPDSLRINQDAVKFVREFVESGKPVAAICHGPWTLIEAGVVKGKTLTSWQSLKTDLTNAGAHWVDREVVEDENLITSRKPGDIPAFSRKIIDQIADGLHLKAAS